MLIDVFADGERLISHPQNLIHVLQRRRNTGIGSTAPKAIGPTWIKTFGWMSKRADWPRATTPPSGLQVIRTLWRPGSTGMLEMKNVPSSLTCAVRPRSEAVQSAPSWAWAGRAVKAATTRPTSSTIEDSGPRVSVCRPSFICSLLDLPFANYPLGPAVASRQKLDGEAHFDPLPFY